MDSTQKNSHTITFELPFHSRLTKKMILELDHLLSFREPKEMKDNLVYFYFDSLIHMKSNEDDIQLFGNMAEDFYFLYQFFTGLEEEILKCEE